ncbi:MAG: hypothetical protein O2930_06730 [Acidobacteria bacterium]|nr:hypothetical protein [Acidobacteriota bacterium]
MNNYRMLACASAIAAFAAAGCAGTPETAEEAAPAAAEMPSPAEAAEAADGEEAAEAAPRLVPAVRGDAQLGYTQPSVRNATIDGRDFVVTTIEVKNLSSGAIAGLTVDEFWYDRAGNPVTGANFRHPRPLQPGEVITVTLETPRNAQMDRNQYSFAHANGAIVATLQSAL